MKRSSSYILALALLLLCIEGCFGKESKQHCPIGMRKSEKRNIGDLCDFTKTCPHDEEMCCHVCDNRCVKPVNRACPDEKSFRGDRKGGARCSRRNVCTDKNELCCKTCENRCTQPVGDFSLHQQAFTGHSRPGRRPAAQTEKSADQRRTLPNSPPDDPH